MTTGAVSDIDARTAAERFLTQSQCSKSRCKCATSARRGHGLTHCPLHADNSPSFNVTVKGDRLLVCCEAGCSQDDIVTLLKENDVWPQRASYGKQIVAEYDYRDANGALLYQTVRYIPKDFRQRRPNGPGKWEWNLEGVPRVLYRLPELLASGNRIVWIVEGEKDVDRLMALGFVATCNVGGAGKWRDEYSGCFNGRSVIIQPDNDESGRQHSMHVARSLEHIAASIRWLELPNQADKADVSDWLDDGGTVEQLRVLATAAGPPPAPPKRERVFRHEGLGYRFEPLEAPVALRFSRVNDGREDTTAELEILRLANSSPAVRRRRLNLLAGSSTIIKGLIEDLSGQELGPDKEGWDRIIRDGFEEVLNAHRNGLVIETVGGNLPAPPPIEWFCDGLLLKHKVNCWLGSAGTGKSTFAKTLAVCHAAGKPFLGRDAGVGIPMYLDWEDDRVGFERTAYEVCRGLDVWPVPAMQWLSMRGKRLRDHVESLGRQIEERRVDVLVLDAIAAAGGSPGEHMSWEAVALELEQCLGQLPPVTVLALDHVTADEHKNAKTMIPVKARGAERKVEFFRNQWTLMLDRQKLREHRHVVTWYHTKINAAAPRPEFTTEIVHGEGRMEIREASVDASPEAVERLPLKTQYVLAVRRQPGQSAAHICRDVRGTDEKKTVDSVRMLLLRERDRGEVYERDGLWFPAGHPGWSKDEQPVSSGTSNHANNLDGKANNPADMPWWNDPR